jgi:hypothetical protein
MKNFATQRSTFFHQANSVPKHESRFDDRLFCDVSPDEQKLTDCFGKL